MSELRVNTIVAAEGTSAPNLPYGIQVPTGMGITGAGGVNITGVVTAANIDGTLTAGSAINSSGVSTVGRLELSKDANIGAAVTVAGISKFTNVTDSTSSTTGGVIVTGGLGVAKNVYIGAGLSVAGTLTYQDVTEVDSVGLITAQSGVNVSGGQLVVGAGFSVGAAGVGTFAGNLVVNGDIDLEGGIDVNGTMEADAITVNGSTLASVIEGTTVTLATNVTVSANNSTNETVYPLFVDGATGTQGAETDTGLTYNPSSGNLGIGGELAAATLDISGNADIDGTMEADAITVNGTALNTVIAGVTVTNATNSSHVLVTDNESTDEDNLICFVENGTSTTGNVGLEMDGNLIYNPSTGTLAATGGQFTNVTGTLQTAAQTNITSVGSLTGLTVTGDLFFDNGSDAGKDLRWDVSADALHFNDSVYAVFGTDSDSNILHDGANFYLTNTTGTLNIRPKASEMAIACVPDGAVSLYYDNSVKLATTNDGVSITGMTTTSAGMTFNGMLKEEVEITAGKLSDNTTIDLADGMIHYFTTQESTTCTPNIRFNSSYTLNNKMATGQSLTVTVITTAAAGGYSANWQIDGTNVTEQWNGGSAPSEGGSDGYDVYTITLIKTAANTYAVFANVSNFT